MEIPRAEEAFLKTSAYANPTQLQREDDYEEDMQKCLAHCAEQIKVAIPEGRFSCYAGFHFKGPAWAGFARDLRERLAKLGYRVKTERGSSLHVRIYWGPTFWEKLFGRKKPERVALPFLPPEELR
jgi:hypothetical protein